MEKDTVSLSSIYARLKSETPRFWKKIRALMIICGTIGAALMAVPPEYTTTLMKYLPENIAGTLFTIGAVGTALSSMTKTDPESLY